ncbi:MAG: DUF305 domain-containing protein [Mycobacterium sp.]
MKWKRLILISAGAVAALVVAAGCGNNDAGTEHPTGHTASATATDSPTTAAPSSQDHNDSDVTFARHMIPHHQQAIEMSDIVLGKQAIDARVTDLATKIKAAQDPEIKQMQDWLNQWGNPPMPPMAQENMPGHDMPGMSDSSMGMMSEQQINALRNAQGVEASRLFLTDMIAHHEGAIAMAQTEIEEGQFPPAVELARSIVTSQQQEIDTMKDIVASL